MKYYSLESFFSIPNVDEAMVSLLRTSHDFIVEDMTLYYAIWLAKPKIINNTSDNNIVEYHKV